MAPGWLFSNRFEKVMHLKRAPLFCKLLGRAGDDALYICTSPRKQPGVCCGPRGQAQTGNNDTLLALTPDSERSRAAPQAAGTVREPRVCPDYRKVTC